MFKTALPLHTICLKLCHEPLQEREIRVLKEAILRFSLAFLKFRQKKGMKILSSFDLFEKELEDIALDAVADLFEQNEKNLLIRLKNYFYPLLDVIDCEEAAVIYLRKLVTSRTQQGLSRIFKERDPESAKLLRNIKLTVIQSLQFYSFEDIRGWYVFKGNLDPPPVPGICLSEKEYALLLNQFKPSDTVPQLLVKTWQHLNPFYKEPFSIELHELMQLFRKYRKHLVCHLEPISQDALSDSFLFQQTKSIINQALIKTEHIIQRYQNEGKLTSHQAMQLKTAITCWTRDLLDGGVQPLGCYFNTSTSQKNYMNIYRIKFEYLIKTIRAELKIQLAEYSE